MVLQYFPKQQAIETQTDPLKMVYLHLFFKGLQIGQGIATAYGLISLLRIRSFIRAWKEFHKSLKFTTFLGLSTAAGVGAYRISKHPELNNKRKFLLQRNRTQNTMDDLMVLGMIIAATISVFISKRLISYMLIGGWFGSSTHIINSQILRRVNYDYDFESLFNK